MSMAKSCPLPWVQTLVIRNTLSRQPPARALPINTSLRPSWYSQALSMKLMPWSMASCTSRMDSSSVRASAKVEPPRPMHEIISCVLPKRRFGTIPPTGPGFVGAGAGSSGVGARQSRGQAPQPRRASRQAGRLQEAAPLERLVFVVVFWHGNRLGLGGASIIPKLSPCFASSRTPAMKSGRRAKPGSRSAREIFAPGPAGRRGPVERVRTVRSHR